MVEKQAAQLRRAGVRGADCVATVLPNGPELVVTLFATAILDAVLLPLAPLLGETELRRYFADTRPRVVLADQYHVARCEALARGTDADTRVLTASLAYLEQVERAAASKEPSRGRALYLYTSGSEGYQKRVCRTQENLHYEAVNFVTSAGLGPSDTMFCLVPLYHSYGLGNGLLAAVGAGATLVLLAPRIEQDGVIDVPFAARCEEVLELIAREQVQVIAGVSHQFAALAGMPAAQPSALSGVRWCFSSGGHLPVDVYRRFFDRFGVPIRQIYGSTETGSVTANLETSASFRPDSVGRPLANVTVKLVGEAGEDIGSGELGAIWVASPVIPPGGYDNRPELNEETFGGGYYRTGDMGRRAEDGSLFVVSRKQTFIETGGYKVDPREVEAVLQEHPRVREVVVLGIDEPALGQIVKAVVVLDGSCGPAELTAYCAERLAAFKVPRKIEIRAALPRSPLGKILKQELLEAGERAQSVDAALPPFYLDMDRSCALDRMAWREAARRAPGPGEVEIEVLASGLNFLDVLSALGSIPDDVPGAHEAGPRLGSECCGRIIAVGEGVTGMAMGDEVVAIYPGAFRSHLCLPAALVARKPRSLGVEEAAALPCVFVTAHYALHHVARLARGERVLIHAAAGGVGLAAIQLARLAGAEIFATAGSEEKRAFLRSLGVAHVMDSRSLDFVDRTRALTDGQGVDVVLNSLGGAFIPASLDLLRDQGRFVELGKRDYYDDQKLGLKPFLRGLQLALVDLRGMLFHCPNTVQMVMREVVDLAERGAIRPRVHRVFPASEVVEAFRFMTEARQIGKIVVSLGDRAMRVEGPREAGNADEREALRADLEAVAAGGRQTVLEARICAEIADALRLDQAQVAFDQPLRAMGFDSLSTIALTNRLGTLTGLSLPVTFAWSHPSVTAIASALLQEMRLAEPTHTPDHTLLASAAAAHPPADDEGRAGAIAIVGMACRFPGGATSPARFWERLLDGFDAITEVPRERWDMDALYDADPAAPGKVPVRFGGFLEGITDFDPDLFGISPREAAQMDPQQRLLLEVAWEAFEDAGIPPGSLAGSSTGVFVGGSTIDFANLAHREPSLVDSYLSPGTRSSILSNRLSYVFDLHGPSMSMDTACSSSLTAVHLACRSLQNRECDAALAGGANILLDPFEYLSIGKARLLSPDGRCKAFDRSANGYVRSEGVGLVLLKRLEDALAAGDPVLAVLRGTALNQDGKTNGLTSPHAPSQADLIRQALRDARVDPTQVTFVEAHGTGTMVGDTLEVEALAEAYGGPEAPRALLGSVKSNIGHTETAAGIAGLIKLVLCLRHQMIPRHVHLRELNPSLHLERTRFDIPLQNVPWTGEPGSRMGAVSSFGFGGAKAHLIVQEAPPLAPLPRSARRASWLLPLSGHDFAALRDQAQALRAHLSAADDHDLEDIAHTAAVRREHHRVRTAVVGSSRADWIAALDGFLGEDARALVTARSGVLGRGSMLAFVFSGQGSQWCGMGQHLLDTSPVFRAAVEACDALFRAQAGWSIIDALRADEANTRVDETEVAQPLIFAVQVGLAALWRSLGVVPDAVVGHSVGEVAAAHVAGVLDLPDAIRVIHHRGRLMQAQTGHGAMASVAVPEAEVHALLAGFDDRLTIGAVNDPSSTVISGDREAIEELLGMCEARGIRNRNLRVNYAFHCPQMADAATQMAGAVGGIRAAMPACLLVSTVSGKPHVAGDYTAAYWGRNIRQPVRFAPAMDTLIDARVRAFIEVGPHPVLGTSMTQCLEHRGERGVVVASERRKKSGEAVLLESLGALYGHGYAVNWKTLYTAGRFVSLPSYPFQRRRCWNDAYAPTMFAPESAPESAPALARATDPDAHPILGAVVRTVMPDGGACHVWELDVSAKGPYRPGDHRVRDMIVFPGAGYVDLALGAARQWLGDTPHELEAIEFVHALDLAAEGARRVQLVMTEDGDGHLSFAIQSAAALAQGDAAKSTFTVYARGKVRALSPADMADRAAGAPVGTPGELRARCPEEIAGEVHQRTMQAQGLFYGPTYQGVRRMWRRDGEALAEPPAQRRGGCRGARLPLASRPARRLLPDPRGCACRGRGTRRDLSAGSVARLAPDPVPGAGDRAVGSRGARSGSRGQRGGHADRRAAHPGR